MNYSKKIHSITFKVDDELINKIMAQANAEHRELSDFIRHCIYVYFDNIEDVKRITIK